MGFVLFFQDLAASGPGVLRHLPRLYTQDPAANLQWLNPVLAWMIPQRSTLFGFSLAPLVMAGLWTALRSEPTRGGGAWGRCSGCWEAGPPASGCNSGGWRTAPVTTTARSGSG